MPGVRRFPLTLALVLAMAALVWVARPAVACTCAPFDTRAALAQADAAFVGTVISRTEPVPDPAGEAVPLGAEVTYRFRVERAVKGDLGSEVEVRSPGDEASCGLSAPANRQVGLLVSEKDGGYHGDLCRQPSPERLLRAAEPLPPPTGALPPSLMVGSTYGNGRTVGLDGEGRVAGVGAGTGTTLDVAVCPGRERVVELFSVRADDGTETQGVVLRRVADMAAESERLLPELRPARIQALTCRDAAGGDVVLFSREGAEGETRGRLVRLAPGQAPATVWEGAAVRHAAFDPTGAVAYLNTEPQGEEIVAVDLDRAGEARSVARVPAGSGPMTVSADSRRLATVATASARPSQVVAVDLGVSPPLVATADLGGAGVTGEVHWAGDRLVFTPRLRPAEPVRIYDAALVPLASWAGWAAEHSAVVGDRLYGVSQGAVRSAPLSTGPATLVNELEDALVVSIADVSRPSTDPPAGAAATPTTTTTLAPPAVAPTTTTTTRRQPAPATTSTTGPVATTSTTVPATVRPEDPREETLPAPSPPGGGGNGGTGLAVAGGAVALLAAGAGLFASRRRRTGG